MELDIKKIGNDNLIAVVSGRIDLDNAAEFGMQIRDSLDDIKNLVIDMKDVTFISSFGLRVILELYKQMKTQGSMKLQNVSEHVLASLKLVGFDKFLTIE